MSPSGKDFRLETQYTQDVHHSVLRRNPAVRRRLRESGHRNASFGANYGTLIKELRIESRAIFVVGKDNVIRYVEYVKEVADFPHYEGALKAARSLA